MIVDESQDFTSEEIQAIKKGAKISTIFFGDSAQQLYPTKKRIIYKGEEKIIEKISTLSMSQIANLTQLPLRELIKNHRLPKTIARFAQLIPNTMDSLDQRCMTEGSTLPVVAKFSSMEQELNFIVKKIKTEGLTDVGVLVYTNAEVQLVNDYFEKRGLSPEMKAGELISLDFNSDNPKILTYHSSKGLQFETVFIPNCNHTWEKVRSPLYVAATRAIKNLYITYNDTLSPFISKIPTSLYKDGISKN
jgi:superfamily I DNA/RNA helicase